MHDQMGLDPKTLFEGQTSKSGFGHPEIVTDGPFAGWLCWGGGMDPFETLIGPFCFQMSEGGRVRTAFSPRRDHLNGAGAIHGGCLMSFADFSLFAIAFPVLGANPAVTLSCQSDFLAPGGLDGLVEGEGDITRATRSMIFVRGLLRQRAEPILSFTGIVKKVQRPA